MAYKKYLLMFIISLISLTGIVSAAHYTIYTDSGIHLEPAVSSNNQSRIFTTTFYGVPPDAENLVVCFNCYETAGHPYVQVGNTSDYRTVTGPIYGTLIDASAWYSWINVSVPGTYDFQNNVIVRIYDNATEGGANFGLKIDSYADNASLKDNQYYDGATWTDETGSWTYGIRLEYDSTTGPITTPTPTGSKISPYYVFTPPTGGAISGADGGLTDRCYFIYDNKARMRQTCNINTMQFYINAIPTTDFYVDFWRYNSSGGFDRIGRSDNLKSSLVVGRNIFQGLSIPVHEGDYYGFTFDGTSVMKLQAGSTDTVYYQALPSVSTIGFGWTAQSTLTNYYIPAEFYTDSLDSVFIGDSIVAGHPGHYSYIESYATHTQPNHTISWNFGNLSGVSTQNMGIGGQTTTQTLARWSTDVTALNPRIVFIEGGVNDVNTGVSNTTILSNIRTEIQYAVSNGSLPVLFNILPWTNADAAKSNQVNYLNEQYTLMTDDFPSLVVIDLRDEVGYLDGTQWKLLPAYDADGIHYNSAGYDLLGSSLYNETFLGTGIITVNGLTQGHINVIGWNETANLSATSPGNLVTAINWYLDGDLVSSDSVYMFTGNDTGEHDLTANATLLSGSEISTNYVIVVGRRMATEDDPQIVEVYVPVTFEQLSDDILDLNLEGIGNDIMSVFTNLLGNMAYAVFFALPIIFIWVNQRSIGMPTLLFLLFGWVFIGFVPAQFHYMIWLAICVSFAAPFVKYIFSNR